MKYVALILPVTLLLASCSTNTSVNTPQTSSSPSTAINNNLTLADCQKLDKDWVLYHSTNGQFSFCYPKVWGDVLEAETTISPEFRDGTSWDLSLSKAPAGFGIYFYTNDFQLHAGRDGGPVHEDIDWSKINASMSSAELAKALQIPNDMIKTVEKSDMNNKFGIKITRDFDNPLDEERIRDVYWMYPQALKNKQLSLVLGGNISDQPTIEKVKNSLKFY